MLSSGLPCAVALVLGCAVDAEPERLGFTDLPAVTLSDGLATRSDFAGRWQGQARDLLRVSIDPGDASLFHFPSGSSDVTLELRIDDSNVLLGAIVFGAAPAAVVVDPLASYPPGATLDDYEENPAALEGARYRVDEGGRDPEMGPEDRANQGTYAGSESDGILRLFYRTADAYADWCAEQPSLLSDNGGRFDYNCLGGRAVAREEDGKCYTYDDELEVIVDASREVDCARGIACLDQCSCDPPPDVIDNPHAIPQESSVPCGTSDAHLGELWLRPADGDLIGVFAGDSAFVNSRGARTILGQLRFERIPDY